MKMFSNDYVLYSYGFYAPAAINSFNGKTYYIVRDEYGLGWDKNYYSGIRKILKYVYKFIEYPWYWGWKKALYATIEKSNLVANSKFIASNLENIAGHSDISVIYPKIERNKLIQGYQNNKKQVRKGFVLVGENILKGVDIMYKIAEYYPGEVFYIFDRQHKREFSEKNIIYMPWQKSSVDIYVYAKIVLIPSRWYEAFSRVALESRILNLPVVASQRGGIPEALGYHTPALVKNIENIQEWIDKINQYL
jgi:glycosyltransferase involved in cell wall biosynthesis